MGGVEHAVGMQAVAEFAEDGADAAEEAGALEAKVFAGANAIAGLAEDVVEDEALEDWKGRRKNRQECLCHGIRIFGGYCLLRSEREDQHDSKKSDGDDVAFGDDRGR